MSRLAWVFSGGGAKGAFGAGVFDRILHHYPQLGWQIVAGTSTGSLIAPFAALAASDRSQARRLVELYAGIRKKDVFKSNLGLFKLITAVFDLPEGLVNLKPLRKLLHRELDPLIAALAATPVDLVVPAANLQTAGLALCTQNRNRAAIEVWYGRQQLARQMPLEFWPFEELIEAMLASSAVPLGTAPIQRGGFQYVDGGVFDKAPLREALALGATEALVVMMSPTRPSPKRKRFGNFVEVGLRAVDLLQDEVLRGDIDNLRLAQRLHARGISVDDIDGAQIAPEVCTYLNAMTTPSSAVAGAAPRPMRPLIIEPALSIGSGEDFDSKVPPTWPESGEPDPNRDTSTDIPIMQARVAYGQRRVDALLAEPGSALKALLEGL
jgi:predicted acylesterase/phospholipase RssA